MFIMDKKHCLVKTHKQTPEGNKNLLLMETEGLTNRIILAGPLDTNKKLTMNKIFDLKDPTDNRPLSIQVT